jgi:hypothetical protein
MLPAGLLESALQQGAVLDSNGHLDLDSLTKIGKQ